jgi:anaerobic selenocysteine-containing dehydrogenase
MDIHPETAKALGINEGDWVWLENKRGKCKQVARFNVGLDPKVVRGEHGWWYPEQEGAEPNLFGVFDTNINNLTTMGVYGPTHYGAPYKSTICKVYKVTPENDTKTPGQIVTREGGFQNARY